MFVFYSTIEYRVIPAWIGSLCKTKKNTEKNIRDKLHISPNTLLFTEGVNLD